MFERIAELFREPVRDRADPEETIRTASAALLVMLMDADGRREVSEERRIRTILRERFSVDDPAADHLLETGKKAASESVEFQHFTSKLKWQLSEDERASFVGLLWDVAYADGTANEMEDNLVWRISELMGVAGRERIFQRQEAAARRGVPVRVRSDEGDDPPQPEDDDTGR